MDTIYGDHVGLHNTLSKGLSIEQVQCDIVTGEMPSRIKYVKGMENPTEGYNNAVRWLVKHGYLDEEIGKVIGGNVLQVLREVWY